MEEEQPGGGICMGGAQQDVIRFVGSEHIVDEVGGDGDLAAGLFLTGVPLLDQTGNDGAVAEGALHQNGFLKPAFKIVAHHVFIEERRHVDAAHILPAPDGERIFRRHEAHGLKPETLQPARQQSSKRLMRESAVERIADEEEAVRMRKGFDEQFIRFWNDGDFALHLEPFAERVRHSAP